MSNIRSDTSDVSDLIFSSASQDISRFRREVTRGRLSIGSRLRSIRHDAQFVADMARRYGLPLVANERCGSWYMTSRDKQGGVYFKSTDGHFGQWSFSLRRLNVALFKLVEEHGGCIVVDSTRRGKSMPDALSKTIPIWAAVWNRTLFPSRTDSHGLRTPADVVGASEHAQIEARLEGFAASLRGLDMNPSGIAITKPLWPVWATRTISEAELPDLTAYHPLVLCTASGRTAQLPDGEDYDYVQGAADDHEAWARGLTPTLFWTHLERLLRCSEDELPEIIGALTAAEQTTAPPAPSAVPLAPTTQIFLGASPAACPPPDTDVWSLVVNMDPADPFQPSPVAEDALLFLKRDESLEPRTLHFPCAQGKLGSRALRQHLQSISDEVARTLATRSGTTILFTSSTAPHDHAVGAALAALCLFFDERGRVLLPRLGNGAMTEETDATSISAAQPIPLEGRRAHVRAGGKDLVRRRLGWLCVACPEAHPSRATLQAVNAFLLSHGG